VTGADPAGQPTPSPVRVRAPGKAMLVGEYAVLDGSPAVVAAIDSFAEAMLPADSQAAPSPFIVAAQAGCQKALHGRGLDLPASLLDRLPLVDTASFARDGRKLGLGSSAAATVAAVGCWYAAAGLDLESDEVRRELAATARAAHDAAQGVRGSGSDILASTWGGLRIVDSGAEAAVPTRLRLPSGLCLRLIATTESASTAQLVARYRQAGDATLPARRLLAGAAQDFIAACQAGASGPALQAIETALDGYVQLGSAIGCALATAEHLAIASAVRSLGGAAKPSGAGGGDLAVALLPDEVSAQRLADRLPATLLLLPLQVSDRGLHRVHH